MQPFLRTSSCPFKITGHFTDTVRRLGVCSGARYVKTVFFFSAHDVQGSELLYGTPAQQMSTVQRDEYRPYWADQLLAVMWPTHIKYIWCCLFFCGTAITGFMLPYSWIQCGSQITVLLLRFTLDALEVSFLAAEGSSYFKRKGSKSHRTPAQQQTVDRHNCWTHWSI